MEGAIRETGKAYTNNCDILDVIFEARGLVFGVTLSHCKLDMVIQ